MSFMDLTGKQFGRWTVLRKGRSENHRLYWLCECSCEAKTQREVWASDLRRGDTDGHHGSLSCGCLMRERASMRSTMHGMSAHPAYRSWQQARNRCRNPEYDGYHLYGGRGIIFDVRWDEFAVFWEDMGATWKNGRSIERTDTNGHYEPGNCEWATPKEQANNRRDNHMIMTPDGEMNVTQAAERYGITSHTLFARIRYGWKEEDLLLPVRPLRMPSA